MFLFDHKGQGRRTQTLRQGKHYKKRVFYFVKN